MLLYILLYPLLCNITMRGVSMFALKSVEDYGGGSKVSNCFMSFNDIMQSLCKTLMGLYLSCGRLSLKCRAERLTSHS